MLSNTGSSARSTSWWLASAQAVKQTSALRIATPPTTTAKEPNLRQLVRQLLRRAELQNSSNRLNPK